MAFTPAEPLTPGDHEDRRSSLLAFNITLMIAAVIALGLRFYSRLRCQPVQRFSAQLWWDDWFAVAAMPFIMAGQTLACVSVHFGFGTHVWDVPPPHLLIIAKIMFANCFIYDAAMTLAKASVLFFYSRIFQTRMSSMWFKASLYGTHAMNVAWWVGAGVGKVMMCKPVAKFWNHPMPGKCGSVATMWLGTGIASVVVDLIVLILPMPIIWNLSMTRARKLALSVVFFCGYCVIVLSIGRVVTIVGLTSSLERDETFKGIPLFFWLSAEVPVAMISICLPAMGQLGRRLSLRLTPSYNKARQALSSNGSLPQERLPSTDKGAKVSCHSARSSHQSSNYQAYAEFTGAENKSSSHEKFGLQNISNKEIHVGNGVTVSTLTEDTR